MDALTALYAISRNLAQSQQGEEEGQTKQVTKEGNLKGVKFARGNSNRQMHDRECDPLKDISSALRASPETGVFKAHQARQSLLGRTGSRLVTPTRWPCGFCAWERGVYGLIGVVCGSVVGGVAYAPLSKDDDEATTYEQQCPRKQVVNWCL